MLIVGKRHHCVNCACCIQAIYTISIQGINLESASTEVMVRVLYVFRVEAIQDHPTKMECVIRFREQN